jgi:hypothetical protein
MTATTWTPVCDRCQRPAVQNPATGKWEHADLGGRPVLLPGDARR